MQELKRLFRQITSDIFCIERTQVILFLIPYLCLFYVGNKLSYGVAVTKGKTILLRLFRALANGSCFESKALSFYPTDLWVGFCFGGMFLLLLLLRRMEQKKFRTGYEHGSARWGKRKDILPYMDYEDADNNILLTKTESMRLNGRAPSPKYNRNKNVLVIGGSGSGKTRFFVKPNLMQLHSSFVVTDPKGTLLIETGKLFRRKHYKIKVFNTINFLKSNHYNPFAYIKTEKDILKLVNTLIMNTKGEGEQAGEDFWVKAEKLYYTALIALIVSEARPEEKNFAMLIDLLDASETSEEDEDFQNAVDLLFEDLARDRPGCFAVRQYKKYKLAAGKTAKSILISCAARLAPFDIPELRDLTAYDELELDLLGERKTILFVIISDTDATFNFLVSIMYSQLFNLLCSKADDVYRGRLPIHVRCILDEFANIGKIPNFEKLIATIRSREISACVILQSKAQLKALYKDSAETIEGNCDTRLFLGGNELTTLKDMAEILGKETIDSFNTSDTKGSQYSSGVTYQKMGRELMTQDELAVMDGEKCILQVRGVRPFLSDKYDIEKHKYYKYLSDYDKQKNEFDVVRYLKRERSGRHTISNEELVDEYFEI